MKEFFERHQSEIIGIAITIVAAIALVRITRFFLNRYLKRNSSHLNADPTNFRFLKNSISVVIYVIAIFVIIYMLPGGKTLSVSLFASAGIIAAIAGFASQAALSNIVGGIFVVMFKPFRVGHIIQIGTDKIGAVEDITLRHTVIRDFQNRRIIIPNSVISNETILNSTIEDEKICRFIEYGISYDSDMQKAKEIIREEALRHPLCIDNRSDEDKEKGLPVVRVLVIGFGDSAVLLRAYVWSNNVGESWQLFTELNEWVKARFDAEGIEIPFPHRTLVYKDKKDDKS